MTHLADRDVEIVALADPNDQMMSRRHEARREADL
jgi:hypothetical protein